MSISSSCDYEFKIVSFNGLEASDSDKEVLSEFVHRFFKSTKLSSDVTSKDISLCINDYGQLSLAPGKDTCNLVLKVEPKTKQRLSQTREAVIARINAAKEKQPLPQPPSQSLSLISRITAFFCSLFRICMRSSSKAHPATHHILATSPPKSTVHGLHNPRNGCYANAAFQLLHHTSLKESVIDQLPDKELQVKQLKVYDAVTGAGDILAGVNTFRNKKTQLSTDSAEDASDVIHTLMDAAGYAGPSLVSSKKISMSPESKEILATSLELQDVVAKDQKEEVYSKGPILLLEPSQTATLEEMLDKTLNDLTEKQRVTNSDEQKAGIDPKFITYKVQSTTRFSKAPKQLMLKTPKYSHLGEETRQAFHSIPEVLNLQKYMIEGAASEPLYLKGFTCHGGSGIGKVGGHYTAYFTKIEDGKTVYYHADDSHVSKISKSAFLKAAKRASELFYDTSPS